MPDKPTLALMGLALNSAPPTLYRPVGCVDCHNQGYRGRTAIMELLKIDADLDEHIARRATGREMRMLAQSKGFRTLAEDGLRRVIDGVTALEEVSRVVDLTDRVR